MNRTALLGLSRAVLSLPTAPYHEQAVRNFAIAHCRALGLAVTTDRVGNLIVRYRHRHTGAPLVYVAHLDHPGFEALSAQQAEFFGGVPAKLLTHGRIRFFTTRGVVQARVKRLVHRHWPRRKVLAVAANGKLQRGEMGMWDLPAFRVVDDRLRAVAIDDVLGVAAVLAALSDVVRRRVPTHLWAVFTRAEEAGFGGAMALAKSRHIPRRAVVVSVEMSQERPWARVGHGPVVRVGDRLTLFDPVVTQFLQQAARAVNRPVQRALMDGGTCEATALAAAGYRVGGLCLPLGNYHNIARNHRPQPEYVSVRDLQTLVELLVQAARAWRGFGRMRLLMRQRVEQIARGAPRSLRAL